jgi:DNA ligase-1
MYKEFPVLYKVNQSGTILEWDICVDTNMIYTEYGQEGGSIQTASYEAYGKNIGRSNETTDHEQAILEAQSKWEHQIKYNGYFKSKEEALKANTSIMPAGGFKPMKAHKWDDHKHKLAYPLYVQPKIDGMRCIAVKGSDEVKLYASSGREILNLRHIKDELNVMLLNGDVIDGELYKHGMPLNQILSIVKREVNPASAGMQEQIKYHVFDTINLVDLCDYSSSYMIRLGCLVSRFVLADIEFTHVHKVYTDKVRNDEQAESQYAEFVRQGYEGMMYRSASGKYEQKRSYNILKRKDFKEDEFKIIGVEDGKGRAAGLAVNFTCLSDNGERFSVSINGSEEYRVSLFCNEYLWKDKYATVRYLNLSEYGIPIIPKCIAIREQIGVD